MAAVAASAVAAAAAAAAAAVAAAPVAAAWCHLGPPQKRTFLDAPEQFLFPKRRKLKDFGWILGAKCGLFPSFFWH